MNTLPILDLSRFRVPRQREGFLAELRHAAHEALPEARRLEIENVRSPQFRGYTRTGTEHTDGGADWREQLDIGPERPALELSEDDPRYLRLIGPNQWPSALPELRDVVLLWQSEALRVAREVLRALAVALGQELTYFDRWFDAEAAAHLKVVHYPPREPGGTSQGVGSHKDYGFLALLHQDEIGGLQVQRAGGSWIDATPIPDSFVVNIGEMLEIATNGYLRATQHRVLSPPVDVDRYSIPIFLAPRLDAVIEPIDLPPELAVAARGVTQDKNNPLLAVRGKRVARLVALAPASRRALVAQSRGALIGRRRRGPVSGRDGGAPSTTRP